MPSCSPIWTTATCSTCHYVMECASGELVERVLATQIFLREDSVNSMLESFRMYLVHEKATALVWQDPVH